MEEPEDDDEEESVSWIASSLRLTKRFQMRACASVEQDGDREEDEEEEEERDAQAEDRIGGPVVV